jgi:hypothetical protein
MPSPAIATRSPWLWKAFDNGRFLIGQHVSLDPGRPSIATNITVCPSWQSASARSRGPTTRHFARRPPGQYSVDIDSDRPPRLIRASSAPDSAICAGVFGPSRVVYPFVARVFWKGAVDE